VPEGKDPRPGWLEEFQKLNAQTAAPPQSAAGGKNPSDRRHFTRFEVDEAPAILRQKGILHVLFRRENVARQALDISEGGARLLAIRRVPPGSPVRVKIILGKFQDSIESDAEIRWCRQSNPAPGDVLLGLMFKDRNVERDRKIVLMRGYFTSPNFLAALEKKQKEISSAFMLRK
jgi:hypothetical protein